MIKDYEKESLQLAYAIREIERQPKKYLTQNKIELPEGYTLMLSKDCMVWYVWKSYPDQVRRFWKAVPKMDLSEGRISKILNAQPWCCE